MCRAWIDGDTLRLRIWLEPSLWLKEEVRLRGIDAPELDAPAGQAARQFVESQFRKSVRLLVTTTKPDKWDPYLADVFLGRADGEVVYLNNLLLAEGHARRSDKVVLADWDAP